jgi:hypothetical protein
MVELLCSSTRVPVVASVTAPPAVTLSDSTATICESDTSAAVTVASIVDYKYIYLVSIKWVFW